MLHHKAWVLQRRHNVTSHGLGVTATVQRGEVVTAKLQCYITWPYCCTYVTMLQHTGCVLQRSYSVTSHGLSVTEDWGYDVANFNFKSERHTITLQHTYCDCHTELSQCTRSLTSLRCYDPSAEGCHRRLMAVLFFYWPAALMIRHSICNRQCSWSDTVGTMANQSLHQTVSLAVSQSVSQVTSQTVC